MRFTISAISLLSFALSSSAAAISSESHLNSWGLIAKGAGVDGVPVVLGTPFSNAGSMFLSNGTSPAEGETRLRFELTTLTASTSNAANVNTTAAKILDHPGIDVDVYMWQTFAAKVLYYGPAREITGKAGAWGFKKVDGEWLLALNDDTTARAVWNEEGSRYGVYFGSDIPSGIPAGVPMVLKGTFL